MRCSYCKYNYFDVVSLIAQYMHKLSFRALRVIHVILYCNPPPGREVGWEALPSRYVHLTHPISPEILLAVPPDRNGGGTRQTHSTP